MCDPMNPIVCRRLVRAKAALLRLAIALGALCITAATFAGDGAPLLRDLGVPVRSLNWARTFTGRNREGKPCIYASMGQNAEGLFVLQIDPEGGQCRQFVTQVPGANFPTAALMSRGGRLYVGAAYAGHLLCFDPASDRFEDLGAINPDAASFPCRIDEDAKGHLWIGSYGTADLTRYAPDAGKFTRCGRMDEVDMYNYPLVSADGKVACLVRMTRPHVVVFDPETGKKEVVGPVITQGKGSIDLRRGDDGKLYIQSSAGNFRIEGVHAVAVDAVPPPAPEPQLPGGVTFSLADVGVEPFRQLIVRKPGGQPRTFHLDYKLSGSDIFCLHAGPDGCVYGSSYLPLHLFRYNPKNGELVDLGRCSGADGEAYSMANSQGKIYISSYPGARLSVYDPAKPYQFGTSPESNPRDLGRIDDISCRPRSTLSGPLGRIWVASIPDYGRWGGPLSWYDTAADKKHAYYRIVGDGSCYTLAHLESEKLIAVGTSISGGSGTQSKVFEAGLFLWDYRAEKKVWEGKPGRQVSEFSALLTGPDGRLYATVQGGGPPELIVFDPKARAFTQHVALPGGTPLDLSLQNGPDGKIYGFTSSCVYRVDPSSLKLTEVIRENGAFSVPGPIVGKDIFFATGHRLRAAKILP